MLISSKFIADVKNIIFSTVEPLINSHHWDQKKWPHSRLWEVENVVSVCGCRTTTKCLLMGGACLWEVPAYGREARGMPEGGRPKGGQRFNCIIKLAACRKQNIMVLFVSSLCCSSLRKAFVKQIKDGYSLADRQLR